MTEQNNWVAEVTAVLERDYPEYAAAATAIVQQWATEDRGVYPFGDKDYEYAALNAAEDAGWRSYR